MEDRFSPDDLVAILAGSLLFSRNSNSQVPGFGQPGVGINGMGRPGAGISGMGGRPNGIAGGGIPGFPGGMPGMPGQPQGKSHWVCGKCNADLGNMPVAPAFCLACGVKFTNGGKFSPEMAREGGPRSMGITGGFGGGGAVPPSNPFPNPGIPAPAPNPAPQEPTPAEAPQDETPKPTYFAPDFPQFPTGDSANSNSSETTAATKSKSDDGQGKTIAIIVGILVSIGVIAGIVFAVVQSNKTPAPRRRRSSY